MTDLPIEERLPPVDRADVPADPSAQPARAEGSRRRAALAILAAVAAATIGALIVGEYEFAGAIPFVAGVLFGLAVGELMLSIAVRSSTGLAVVGAVVTGAGLAWAAWISSGRGVAPYPTGGYVAIALGVVVAGSWIALPSRPLRRRDRQ